MSDKTRNEWQKRWLLSPLYRLHIVPIYRLHIVPIMALYRHFTDFDCLRKSRRASFLRTISVKSGIEPVLLCQSNYTSTSWSTTSAIVLVSALKEQGNPKVCQKIQVYKGYISNIKISKNLHIFHLWKYYYKCCKICEYNTYFWLIKV